MRRAGLVIVALVLAGCSSGAKNGAPPAATTPTSVTASAVAPASGSAPPTTVAAETGLAFIKQWCPQVETQYQKILTLAGKPGAAPPNVADVVTADELFVGGPFASLKATVDSTDVAHRPLKAVAEIGVAADWCKSNGY